MNVTVQYGKHWAKYSRALGRWTIVRLEYYGFGSQAGPKVQPEWGYRENIAPAGQTEE